MKDGKELQPQNNPGVWLNHSRRNPNCKIVAVRDKGVIVGCVAMAIRDISEGEELCQDYGRERARAGPSFLNE